MNRSASTSNHSLAEKGSIRRTITEKAPAPPTEDEAYADTLTQREEVDLSPAARAAYTQTQFREHLLAENQELQTKLNKLEHIATEHAALVYARGWQVWLSSISGAAVAGGGLLIGTQKQGSAWFIVGCASIIVAVVLMVGNAAVRPAVARPKKTND